ncbi:DUF6978 family protein [Weissella paramesenteroides]|uniref:DUF6978 family protein n=1 Tax=Weissella paramesenteroides TaxID=1249 RepID=UPI00398378CB
MDYDSLTTSEITELVTDPKKPANNVEYNDIYNEIVTTILSEQSQKKTVILDTIDDSIDYILTTNQSPIETRFTIALILKINHYTLVRYDFGKTLKHTNDYGTDHEQVIRGSHVHIYCAPNKYSPKNVYPISDFPRLHNIELIKSAFLEFISFTHIK